MRLKRKPLIGLVAAGALALSACGGDGGGELGEVTVGSANFPESILMGNIYAGALDAAGFDVNEQFNIGAREAYAPALEAGEIDVLPEYIGAFHAWAVGDQGDVSETDELLAELEEHYSDGSVVLYEPSEAENASAFLVTPETADEYGLETLSDLEPVAGELTAGGPPEVRERPDGLPGLQEVYGVEFGDFLDLDACGPITNSALADGDIDVARSCSALGIIGEEGWIILEDDQHLMVADNLIPVVRGEAHSDELEAALNEVSAALTTEGLIELNRRIEIDNDDPDVVAQDWLAEQGIVE